ncbi:MAG: thioredoxin-disulfide reductase [Candidatus Omnitrophota bacterium]
MMSQFVYDVIIVGAGPAGLTAGLYAGRAKLKTLLIEGVFLSSQAVVTSHIENYPGFPEGIGGFELIDKFRKQAQAFGAEFFVGDVQSIQGCTYQNNKVRQVSLENKIYNSLSLIIASGARPKELGVSGEEKFRGKGVSYCAVCDGAFFKDKDIVVIGGGNAAVEEALFLTKFGKKITLIHRRGRLRAAKILQERVFLNKKIEIVWDSAVCEILGSQKVEAVRIMKLITKKESEISCDGVFIFVGLLPNTNFARDVVELDSNSHIVVDDKMATSREGIFACGDCRKTLLRQIVTACGDGALAAYSAQQYVEELKGVAYK